MDVTASVLSAQIEALSGDISAPKNSNTTTLATVNANVGTFGNATNVSQITLDAKGRATAASNVAITFPADFIQSVIDTTSIDLDVTANALTAQREALTGDITAPKNSNTTTLATVNAVVGTFGSATKTTTVTANTKGLITAISEQDIAISESQVTNLITDLRAYRRTFMLMGA